MNIKRFYAVAAILTTSAMLTAGFALPAGAVSVGESSTAAVSVQTSRETEGDYEYSVLDDGTVEIKRYNGSGVTVVIPREIDGKMVTSIGQYAFEECDFLTSVTLPETVKNIGEYAFVACTSLESVTIPDSVKSIAYDAFPYRTSLTVYANSYAEQYAKDRNISYTALSECPVSDTEADTDTSADTQQTHTAGDISGDGKVNMKISQGCISI